MLNAIIEILLKNFEKKNGKIKYNLKMYFIKTRNLH